MKRSLDIASIVGLLLAVGLIVFGIVTNTDAETREMSTNLENLKSFWDIASVSIVFGGTLGCLLLMFPLSQFAKIPKQLLIVFLPNQYVPIKYIEILVACAKKARVSGLLALEEDTTQMEDAFLKNSLQMVVDSVDPEKVKTQMESWLDDIDERHTQERSFYDKGAALGPAFGMIGTIIGLINMMKNLQDIESIGPNMAVALVTTFYGSLLANVIFTPISNKLRVRHDEEYLCMHIICEGVQAIQAGENPNLIQDRLLHL
ncbi:MAG: MotA/TolQ/ExbB proton channel family protein, partial [Ruthenibacterium sp.]